MRVITGTARGVQLTAPEGLATRPTIDRVKEAVFSALQFDLYGARVLDLFAGSGQLGIEALSRGAAEAVFVDAGEDAAQAVRENLRRTRLAQRARLLTCDWEEALRRLRGEPPFRFVFLDPPYRDGLYVACMERLCSFGLVDRNSVMVAESSETLLPPEQAADFVRAKHKKFGKVGVCFYRHRQYEEG